MLRLRLLPGPAFHRAVLYHWRGQTIISPATRGVPCPVQRVMEDWAKIDSKASVWAAGELAVESVYYNLVVPVDNPGTPDALAVSLYGFPEKLCDAIVDFDSYVCEGVVTDPLDGFNLHVVTDADGKPESLTFGEPEPFSADPLMRAAMNEAGSNLTAGDFIPAVDYMLLGALYAVLTGSTMPRFYIPK